ncbi:MAG: GGDEF domain-containing protein [Pseudomonadota bacterium]
MEMGFSAAEGRVLHGLLEESAGDIVIKLDERGFIEHASANITAAGFDLASLLLPPHITELVARDFTGAVVRYMESVMRGEAAGWIEFPLVHCAAENGFEAAQRSNWYALSVRLVASDNDSSPRAIGLLRSVEHLRGLEEALHERALTDPLTGLSNKSVLCASLRRHLASGKQGTLAILAVDRLRAIFMQYGQRTADEVCWGFAKFLETMTTPEQELARIDGERFGVILPGMNAAAAREWADDVLHTFSALTEPASTRSPQLSASAGIAAIECTVDWSLRQAELALVMACASGGMQIGQYGQPPVSMRPHQVEETASLGVVAMAR